MGRSVSCTSIVTLLTILIFGSAPFAASGRASAPKAWSAAIGVGAAVGLSTRGVSNAMRAGGYDDPTCVSGGLFSCDEIGPTPYSEYAGVSWDLSIRRRVNPTTWLELLVARDKLARTIGYRDEVPAGEMYLNQTAASLAFLIGKGRENADLAPRHPWGSIGPALFRVAINHETPPHQDTPNNVSAILPGAVASIGYAFGPRSRRFVSEVQLRCNLIPPVKLGPVRLPLAGNDPAGSLPRTTINFTHVVIFLRLGMRI
jgi:hypothetical protein